MSLPDSVLAKCMVDIKLAIAIAKQLYVNMLTEFSAPINYIYHYKEF